MLINRADPIAEPHSLHDRSSDMEQVTKGAASTVFVVDGSTEFRGAVSLILAAAGHRVRLFESAEGFLAAQDAETPGCVLLEERLPGMSGLELQRALFGSLCARPIVFLTGKGDIQTSVRAMKAGAVDFLTKPVGDERLFGALDQALRRDAEERKERAIHRAIQLRLETLTRRERQVMALVIRGRLNKQICADLGTVEKTVKVHRGRVMSKMRVRSVPELVQLGVRVGISIEPFWPAAQNALSWRLASNFSEPNSYCPA
jgi:FixJ family two-component response regulator